LLGTSAQQWQEPSGKKEWGKIIDGEPEFKAVRANLALRGSGTGAKTGIVDQNVQPRPAFGEASSQSFDLRERREVRIEIG